MQLTLLVKKLHAFNITARKSKTRICPQFEKIMNAALIRIGMDFTQSIENQRYRLINRVPPYVLTQPG
ncbi:hypothetical protein PSYJA_27034 [Pseudomonas syringae pv. japonica str. M301072]|uniref:Uncharacterized protein n=1 Tax=Pseudomonas syringae pv. japonica str. M301072 TaxID=629262 RepID=F3FQC3_PSESX|nr:hypothetical protein PSYJA_27034 [Pseudomonas syringae pv. japonica str. M301072]